MPDEFDPYHTWLGIPPSEQPANHYRLLGVSLYESKRDVIQNAADARMSLLKTITASEHLETAQRLLNEVAEAKVCLLNDSQKQAYDDQLRGAVSTGLPAQLETPVDARSVHVTETAGIGGQRTRVRPPPLSPAGAPRLWHDEPDAVALGDAGGSPPSFCDYAQYRLWIRRQNPSSLQMMRRADWHYGIRLAIGIGVLVAFLMGRVVGFREGNSLLSQQSGNPVDGSASARTDSPLGRSAGEPNAETMRSSDPGSLHPLDSNQLQTLITRLLTASPTEVGALRAEVKRHGPQLLPALWAVLEEAAGSEQRNSQRVLAAASHLASAAPDEVRWESLSSVVARSLVRENSLRLAGWVTALNPIQSRLREPLGEVFRNQGREHPAAERNAATQILAKYAADDIEQLTELILDADSSQIPGLVDVLPRHSKTAMDAIDKQLARPPGADAERTGKRQANAAVALMRMGASSQVWPLLKSSSDPTVRSWLIHRLATTATGHQEVAQRLEVETVSSIRQALILILGRYETAEAKQEQTAKRILRLFGEDPDAGVHSAAEWTLRRWGKAAEISELNDRWASAPANQARDHGWQVTSHGHTMVAFLNGRMFQMGSPATEKERHRTREAIHQRRIERSFAVASKEVTVTQFQEFLRNVPLIKHKYTKSIAPDRHCPQISVSWYQAAAYCRWLSEQEGIPTDQMCYPSIPEIREGMQMASDYLRRTGYRLPTEAEWEFACRGAAKTPWAHGQSSQLLPEYGWFAPAPSAEFLTRNRTLPVGQLMPNQWGLFDTYGNVQEWCQERFLTYAVSATTGSVLDTEDTETLSNENQRVMRGGSYNSLRTRSATRSSDVPSHDYHSYLGFRLARTIAGR